MMHISRLAAGVVLLASFASTGFAQTAAPTTSSSPREAGVKVSVPSTADFLKKAAVGNKFEIDSSKLALDKSKSEAVRTFANMMIKDHGEAAVKMRAAVTEAQLSAPADALDARHKQTLDDLSTKDGSAFDKAYVEAQLKGHEETVALFQAYANVGDNARIKRFAKDLLPTLQMHLEHVRKLKV